MQFDYFLSHEAEQFTFYRIPKVLITEPQFKVMSADAKLLYGLLLDRMSLSQKNSWFDEQNRVYINYTVVEVIEDMSCGRQKAIKLLDELEYEVGLIERRRPGQGRPNRIYVKKFTINKGESVEGNPVGSSYSKKFERNTSESIKHKKQEVRNSKRNKNNKIKTDLSETDTDTARADTADAVDEQLRSEFNQFIAAYPPVPFNEEDAWREFKRSCIPIEDLMNALASWKESSQWKEEGGRYIPSPRKFLRDGYCSTKFRLAEAHDNEPSTPLPSTVCKRSAKSSP